MIDIDFRYYFAVFRKRLPLFLLVWTLFAGLGVMLAYILPPVYRSQATILVESQGITLVDATVRTPASEQIQKIETLLMTRPNLLEISERFDVFVAADDLSPTEIAEAMRDDTSFQQVRFSSNNRNGPTTVAFTVSYSHKNPVIANRVAGELVTRILERNIDDRKNTAIETYEYFKQERARLLNDLTDLETQIVNLKNENKDSLPERLNYNQAELSRIQERLIQLDREELAFKEQRERLQRVLDNPALAAQAGLGQQTPQQRELEQLTLELAQKSTIYSESNPQIVQLRSRIAALEGIIAGASEDAEEGASDALFSPLREEIRQINNKLDLISRQRISMEGEMSRFRGAIDQTPNVENQLNILDREHATIELQYRENEALLSDAAAGQALEINNQGQRFTVVEQPQIPDEPESPNRILIAAGGIGFGLAAGMGLLVLLEILNSSVRRPADLIGGLGIQPFATIPFIETKREIMRRRLKLAFGMLAVGAAVPAAVMLVHYYVMPVDLLLDQVLERFGLPKFTSMIS